MAVRAGTAQPHSSKKLVFSGVGVAVSVECTPYVQRSLFLDKKRHVTALFAILRLSGCCG